MADHPEYPSGSAAFCAAISTTARLFFGDDKLSYVFPVKKGSSNIEPGVTLPSDTKVRFNSWTEFMDDCGNSRVRGGVHFPHAVEVGRILGEQVGKCTYRFVQAHI